ncbi:4Fe-4S dicluster domain-containing protein [Bacteriovoracaceae bacterium]|nr:4Fe-4S dicluster domain-containing protein [Bacteriovoracaceae bacterium]
MSKIKVPDPKHTARQKEPRKGKRPPKLLAVVHQSGCTGCEVCIAGCPVDSIELVSGPNPDNPVFQQTVEIDLQRCIGCQNCSFDCPWETITMYNHDDAYLAWGNETLKSELYVDVESVELPKIEESETESSSEESNDDLNKESVS